MSGDTALNRPRRARELAEATDGRQVDLLVIGLGATGAGVALDAASRGLSVVAVDAHDLAFGTSRWSSKLAHGGLRYLAHGQVGTAHESAAERGILLRRTAPHLVRPSRWLVPLTPDISRGSAAVIGAGFVAGDVLRRVVRTPSGLLPRPGRVGAARARELAPALRHDVRGGITAWDARIEDDARLVIALARTAAGRGARVLTRVRALDVAGDGARVRDELTGTAYDITARAVVNATGVWAGGLVPGVTSGRRAAPTSSCARRRSAGAESSSTRRSPAPWAVSSSRCRSRTAAPTSDSPTRPPTAPCRMCRSPPTVRSTSCSRPSAGCSRDR